MLHECDLTLVKLQCAPACYWPTANYNIGGISIFMQTRPSGAAQPVSASFVEHDAHTFSPELRARPKLQSFQCESCEHVCTIECKID